MLEFWDSNSEFLDKMLLRIKLALLLPFSKVILLHLFLYHVNNLW